MAGSLKAVKFNFSSTPYVLREVSILQNVDLFNVGLRIKRCNLVPAQILLYVNRGLMHVSLPFISICFNFIFDIHSAHDGYFTNPKMQSSPLMRARSTN